LNGLIGIGTIKNLGAQAATGFLLNTPASTYINGETFTLNDGVNPATIFEFRHGGSVTPGNVLVNIALASSPDDVRNAEITAINGVGAGLAITASNGGAGRVDLVNDAAGSFGNQLITDTVANPGFTHGGMSGGAGANGLVIKETTIDVFGVTTSVSTTVAAGDEYLLDLQTSFANITWPPFVSYLVEVEDKVAGNHAAFDLYLTTVESTGSSGTISFPPSTYVFTSPDVLTTTDNALIPWIPGTGRMLSELLGLVKTAPGTQAIIIEFFRGDMATGTVGASLGTVTIPPGSFFASSSITPTLIGVSEFVAMTINQVGIGPAGSNLTGIGR
jgi:hypothetical protein